MGGSKGLEVVRNSGHVQGPRVWECEGRSRKSSVHSLKPPDQPPQPRWTFMSAKYNFTTHTPPVSAAQHRPMVGERLPPCPGLVQVAEPLGAVITTAAVYVPTVPDISHPPVLTVDLGEEPFLQ